MMNGIHPAISVTLTVIVIALTVLLFATGHWIWGIILALISLDFAADAVLSFGKPKKA